MQELHSLSDAQQWFLENRDDAVICVKTVEHKCTTYPEAKALFDTVDDLVKVLSIPCNLD